MQKSNQEERVPEFRAIVEKMLEIHVRKNHDYSVDSNPFSNFEHSAAVAHGFSGVHASFATLIGTKLARLAVLLAPGKTPKNETIEDTFVDLCTYCVLWACYFLREKGRVDDEQLRSGGGQS